jgi:acylphosphatase
MKLTQAHVFISGKVQGVGYRYFTHRTATQLGLTGWVRNLPDARVEAVFQGSGDKVEQMICWCHRGSPSAVVDQVTVAYEPIADFQSFEIKR